MESLYGILRRLALKKVAALVWNLGVLGENVIFNISYVNDQNFLFLGMEYLYGILRRLAFKKVAALLVKLRPAPPSPSRERG